jgi:opacity protein-like surface antigen
MKKLFVVLLAAFLALPAFSQLEFGIKAGVSTTSISMDDAVSLAGQAGTYTVEALKNANFGYHAGVFVRLGKKLYLQPEVLFASTENIYNVTDPGQTAKEVIQKMNNLSIPVMVGIKFGPLRVNAGPAAALALSTPKELIDDPNLKDMYSKTSFGYQAGIGLDLLKKLTVDVRYEGSLLKYQNQIENLTGTKVALDNRPNAFLFSVGLKF